MGLLTLLKLLRDLRIDPKNGIIKSKYGIRYILLSDDSILAIQDDLEKIVGKDAARGLAYRIGYEAGKRFAKPFKEAFKNQSSYSIARKCGDFAQLAGWGKHKIQISENENKAIVIVYDSPLSQLKKNAKEPVCNLHCGLLAGSASIILGKKIVGEEVNCVAKGDPFCKFILRIERGGENDKNGGKT
ncbi:MAG: hypothetical protein DRO65_04170 [Candidatus Altiarchaeales archaeon]|nr:MAG: hypothetical protein DRO65_04170 [Candidatus Altiarchaeales archaeon]